MQAVWSRMHEGGGHAREGGACLSALCPHGSWSSLSLPSPRSHPQPRSRSAGRSVRKSPASVPRGSLEPGTLGPPGSLPSSCLGRDEPGRREGRHTGQAEEGGAAGRAAQVGGRGLGWDSGMAAGTSTFASKAENSRTSLCLPQLSPPDPQNWLALLGSHCSNRTMEGSLLAPLMNSSRDSLPAGWRRENEGDQQRSLVFVLPVGMG